MSAPAKSTARHPPAGPPLSRELLKSDLSLRRVEATLFGLIAVASAYFCPGGGWNQNARFDQVRAIVEGGTFAINDFLVYARAKDNSGAILSRRPLPPETPTDRIWRIGNSGDVTRHGDPVYPGKPPGAVLLAVPAYSIIYHVEKWLGVNPDDWWPLTLNAYLTRLFSVGLLTAVGMVAFFRISRRMFPHVGNRAHILSALSLGLGTMLWPFGTLFFDHNIVAVLLLTAFSLLVDSVACSESVTPPGPPLHGFLSGAQDRVPSVVAPDMAPMPRGPHGRLCSLFPAARSAFGVVPCSLIAGFLLGLATVCNYLTAIPIAIFSIYALARTRPVWRIAWLWAGGLLPAIFLAWYHTSCFGSVTATANTEEPGMFQDSQLFLGMFGVPDRKLVWALLFSSYRGLFFFSPVLFVALAAGIYALVRGIRRPEMIVCLAIFASYLTMNASFQGWSKGWSGSWSFGPRYLIPALPFVALPLCLAFQRLRALTSPVAGYSILLMLLGTAVDPQPPVDVKRPIGDYLAPLAQGRSVRNGKTDVSGVVSANPIGVYEGFYHRAFPAGSEQVRWNSFNLGEFIWPHRRLSLLPLIAVLGAGFIILWRLTRSRQPASLG